MEVGETNWQYSPKFVLDEIFDRLALADLRTASRVCLNWRERASLAANRWDRLSLTATHFQWEPIRYNGDSILPGMIPREAFASCYHAQSGKVYLFGGEVPTTIENPPAELNDLWSLDLARRRWERVIVRSKPYPMPKSMCSLIAWGDFLVLVGGLRYVQNPNNGPEEHRQGLTRTCTREIHRFDTRKKEWIEMSNDSQAPGIFNHSSVVFRHFLIVIGGLSYHGTRRDGGDPPMLQLVHVFDLQLGCWHEPSFAAGSHENWSGCVAACTCVLLRPGCILVHPSIPFIDHNRSKRWVAYLLHFDPNDLTQEWRSEMIPIEMDQYNFNFDVLAGQIGVVQVNNATRLLQLVFAERIRVGEASQMARRMKTFKATVCTALRDHIRSQGHIERFYNSLYAEPFRIQDETNAYILSPGKSGKQSDVQVTVESLHPTAPQLSPAEVDLKISFIQSSFLPGKLRSKGWSICENAIRLHTDVDDMEMISIDLDRVEDEKQLRWTRCEKRGEASPGCFIKFSFISAGGQMVLHGGSSVGGLSGGTYILNPVAS